VGVSDANHIVAAQVYVHLTATFIVGPPEPEYRNFGVYDARVGDSNVSIQPFVFQQSQQPLEPLDTAQPFVSQVQLTVAAAGCR